MSSKLEVNCALEEYGLHALARCIQSIPGRANANIICDGRAIKGDKQLLRSCCSNLTGLSESQEIAGQLDELKALFPPGSAPKGKSLLLLKRSSGELAVEYEGRTLGIIKNSWIAKQLLLGYFADKAPISIKVSKVYRCLNKSKTEADRMLSDERVGCRVL